jgi:hypothetical protein
MPRCRMIQTTFAGKPIYEALPYTWGDDTTKKIISLNGYEFGVSTNLFEALIGLRSSRTERVLWIDAISINQRDTDDRNSQLQLMPFIYKRAKTVLVWLGSFFEDDIPEKKETLAKSLGHPRNWKGKENKCLLVRAGLE